MTIAKNLFFREAQHINYVIRLNAVNKINTPDNVIRDLNDQINLLGVAFRRPSPLAISWNENGKEIPESDPRIIQLPVRWSEYRGADLEGRKEMVKNTIIPKIEAMELPVISWT